MAEQTALFGKPGALETRALFGRVLGQVQDTFVVSTSAGEFVWAKRTTEREGNEQLLRVYETALVFVREPLAPLAESDPPRCWCVAAGYDDDGEAARWGSHPNHKPFTVLDALLREWSRPGHLVLDPFAGSGSIPAAALRLGRRAACIEIEPEWVARVNERLSTGTR